MVPRTDIYFNELLWLYFLSILFISFVNLVLLLWRKPRGLFLPNNLIRFLLRYLTFLCEGICSLRSGCQAFLTQQPSLEKNKTEVLRRRRNRFIYHKWMFSTSSVEGPDESSRGRLALALFLSLYWLLCQSVDII